MMGGFHQEINIQRSKNIKEGIMNPLVSENYSGHRRNKINSDSMVKYARKNTQPKCN